MPTELNEFQAACNRLRSILADHPDDLSGALARLTEDEFICVARVVRASFFRFVEETGGHSPTLLNYLRVRSAKWWCECFTMSGRQVIAKALIELPSATPSRH
jgi:hypothetical protein